MAEFEPAVIKQYDALRDSLGVIVVDDLDTTIRDIRGAIFQLRAPQPGGIRAQVRELTEEARATLGFRPQLALDGPLDDAVPEPVGVCLVAVLREALSNVGRHAQATEVEVGVEVSGGRVILTVTDNGVGIGEVTRAGGLHNMRTRATELDGTFSAAAAQPRGTRLVWSVPI